MIPTSKQKKCRKRNFTLFLLGNIAASLNYIYKYNVKDPHLRRDIDMLLATIEGIKIRLEGFRKSKSNYLDMFQE